MSLCPKTGIPFARIAPVYAAQGEGVYNPKNAEYKEFRGQLRLIHNILFNISKMNAAEKFTESLKALRDGCTGTLGLVATDVPPETRRSMLIEVGTFKQNLNAADNVKALKEIKDKLTENLNICTKETTAQSLGSAIDAQLQSFEAINRKVSSNLSVIESNYKKFQTEAERLRHKIDTHTENKRPSKLEEETIAFRGKLSVTAKLIGEKLDKADSKEPIWKERLETLTKEWNELAVQAAEVNGLIQAINTLKPVISDLLTAKFKLEQINKQIKTMQGAYTAYEKDLLAHEFDSRTHAPKEKTFADLRTLETTNAKELKEDVIKKVITNNNELIAFVKSLKPYIEKALSSLQTLAADKKPIEESNKLHTHQAEVDQLFSEVHKKNTELFKDLESQITTAWADLRDGLKQSNMNLEFINGTSAFTEDIAKLYVDLQEFAKNLRDARQSSNLPKDYDVVHKPSIAKWNELNGKAAELIKTYQHIKKDFTLFTEQSAAALSRKDLKPNDDTYVKEETIKHFQKEFKEKYEKLILYFETNLPVISRKGAQELNRGLDALQVKDFGDSFKNAFVTESRHNASQTVHQISQKANALTQAATAMIPEKLKGWGSTNTVVTTAKESQTADLPEAAAPIVYFQSAFDTLNA